VRRRVLASAFAAVTLFVAFGLRAEPITVLNKVSPSICGATDNPPGEPPCEPPPSVEPYSSWIDWTWAPFWEPRT
jgi:hypothetical protein